MSGSEGRRWPLIAAWAGFGILLGTLYPNPFGSPSRQPGTSAEYAPTPGAAKGMDVRLAPMSSGESPVRGGRSGVTFSDPSAPYGALPQYRPRQRACVGQPARQTEDPLSPPCVPEFVGFNGGATAPGVTEQEILVVVYNDHGVQGDLNAPWKPSDESGQPDDPNRVRTFKSHLRHFLGRYQTYGRRVRAIAQRSTDGWTTPCSARRNDARQTLALEPFAVVYVGFWGADCYRDVIASEGVMLFGLNYDIPRRDYRAHAPNWWGFFPDQETMASLSASFLCDKLHGLPARFSADPNLRERMRTFGFIRPRNAYWGPEREQIAQLLEREAAERCGLRFVNMYFTTDFSGDAGTSDFIAAMQRFKLENITTVICYCVTDWITTFQNGASSIAYFPEWYWDMPVVTALYAQLYADPKQRNLAMSVRWRQPRFEQQTHYRVYQEHAPGSAPDPLISFDVYYSFLTLFQGIQGAGPRLSSRAVQRGMFTYGYQALDDPWHPTGGYGRPGGPGAGPHSFIDTAMAVWWDPAGTAPGGLPDGCLRVANRGTRVFAGGWAHGDGDLFVPGAPCTQGEIKRVDDSDPSR